MTQLHDHALSSLLNKVLVCSIQRSDTKGEMAIGNIVLYQI